ncbi:MAG: hypothetical protein EOQ86_28505 [Mesorhizobium sp.]|uniref:hypothetical protein n=1 Tax=Mesorhizobium sp. TaxID=1871066 RepID=UPI000FE63992|nr:hypothetical protein [Mesorhizobium sp.]RWH73261.1 MAG: hypothetical protein EOQ85_26645 [Mesorhizobium sp.]RWH77184.1 MAG: hypothetical protein EOQ86_28505 [Mesorhizobium sp.]RWH81619.1 MAG: hypothetical protein EOQ87_34575 [Mesorhizobium sp.]RWH92407.1 MAG: hypothetical protein EOQ88_29620 [Mesorhizobium sp.]RWH97163.1 MAG: hypothetical protein EOQ89_27425 [Mesorhizobium sp.]
MRFELARIFLLERKQSDVFERRAADGSKLNREQWLRGVFSQEIDFIHRKSERRFVPDQSRPKGEQRIVARIGRKTLSHENDPDDHLREITREQWRACLVIIDPTSHDDGQKVAIETSSIVGSGFGNFESLITTINGRSPPEPFVIELHSITDQTTFWEYIERHKGKITSITLEVVMPNMFGGSSSFEEDAKRLRDNEKARRIKETIENEDGLEPDTERMRDAVSYATRGGGKVKAKAKGTTPYDSTKDKKYIDADVNDESKDLNQKTEAAMAAFNKDKNDIESEIEG